MFNSILGYLCSTALAMSVNICAPLERILYCEATRIQDDVEVQYIFRVVGNRAFHKNGTWTFEKTSEAIILHYVDNGIVSEDAVIEINRATGALIHQTGSSLSTYVTLKDDQTCSWIKRL